MRSDDIEKIIIQKEVDGKSNSGNVPCRHINQILALAQMLITNKTRNTKSRVS